MFTNKKILFVTTTDNMIWQFLLPHIKFLQDAGNTVECACSKTGFWFDELQEKYGLTMHNIPLPRSPFSLKLFLSINKIKKLVKSNKYDLINCHQPVGGAIGRLVGHRFKLPVIYTAHGFHFYKGCSKKNLLYKFFEKYFSKYTDALVTMNEEDYQVALKFKAKKVYKINGIGLDLNKYEKFGDTKQIKTELKITDKDFVILSIGELNNNKNHRVIIEAIAKLKNAKVKYFICGSGGLKDKYSKRIKDLGLEDQIKLLGFRKDINQIISASDLFVMPSFREGLPRSIMESMCAGLPIIASNIRGCKDLVDEEKGGFLVAPTDVDGFVNAISKILSDKKLQEDMGNYNKEKIKDYSIEKVLEEMTKIYNIVGENSDKK